MAKNSKVKEQEEQLDEVVEKLETIPDVESVADDVESKVEPKKISKKQSDEVIEYLDPNTRRASQNGVFLYNKENLFVVAESDGKKFSFPYIHASHKDLKEGDEISF